jgi:hypothetical protein
MNDSLLIWIYVCGLLVSTGFVLWGVHRPRGWYESASGSRERPDVGTILFIIGLWPLTVLALPIFFVCLAVKFVAWLVCRPIVFVFRAQEPFMDTPMDDSKEHWQMMRYHLWCHWVSLRIVFLGTECDQKSYRE